MSEPINTEIIIGKDLPEDVIKMMADQRIKEYGENTKDFRNNEKDSIFFFLKEGNKVKAFGMLKPVTLYYQNKEYPIMGLANVIAVEKSQGYGTKIMKVITDYLEINNIPALGNTYYGNFDFYKKCGYLFFHNLIDRMVYIMPNGKESKTERDGYDMFIHDPKKQLSTIVNGNENIIIKVPFW